MSDSTNLPGCERRECRVTATEASVLRRKLAEAIAASIDRAEAVATEREATERVKALLRQVVERTVPSILAGVGIDDPLWIAVRREVA